MKFIKKKNLLESEELLYIPNLHWMYAVSQPVLFLLLIPVLLILRVFILSIIPMDLFYLRMILNENIIQIILAVLIVSFIILACRIFLYLSFEYGVTNKRLLMKKGIFRVVSAEITMDRIESIHCVQGIMGKIFNYGTIRISGIGGRMPVFFMVMKPYALRRKIIEIIEKNKTITVIHGDLPRPKPVATPKPVVEEEPVYRYGTFVRMSSDDKK
jgi:membrane protein YdbS with pleckstrin-like domain